MLNQLDEITQDIYHKYRSALKAIGVDLTREDVQEAIINCDFALESAFQSVIEYWLNLQKTNKTIDYPSALLIQAINNHWIPHNWNEQYLSNSCLQSPCVVWWEEAGKIWGQDLRNQLIADVNETDAGEEYILLSTEEKISLRVAKLKGWDWVLQYAQLQQQKKYQNSFDKISFS